MSLINGYNQTTQEYLVFTPANRAEIYTQLEGNSNERGVKPYLKISFMGVAKQNHVPLNSDYIAPPNAYSFFNFDAGFKDFVRIEDKPSEASYLKNTNINFAIKKQIDTFDP